MVSRQSSPTDRRAWVLRLTPKGKSSFEAMAQAHSDWIAEMFEGLGTEEVVHIHQHLGLLRVHLQSAAS
jgi:DNA-binding MarR family transcriptional regulator